MCTYALYRKLFPGEEAREIWRKLWAMQKKIPIVEAHNFVCVYVCVFMQQVAPLSKKSRSMDPAVTSYLFRTNQSFSNPIWSNCKKCSDWK